MVLNKKIQPDKFAEIVGSAEMVKVVVDIEREVLSLGCELHIDCAEELERDGSSMKNLWGANLYPADKRIDYVSLINIRPLQGNRSMEIQDGAVRQRVEAVIHKLLF